MPSSPTHSHAAEPAFRPARPADIASILELQRGYYAEDGYVFDDEAAEGALRALAAEPTLGRLWVAEDADGVAGYLAVTLGFSLEYRGRDAFVDELFLAPRLRGRGMGRRALVVARDFCRERGVRALHLEVEHHRDPALELYRRFGFVDHERRLMTLTLSDGPSAPAQSLKRAL
jgi:ribosomal protein S18 acetylase RimI-like enzyme